MGVGFLIDLIKGQNLVFVGCCKGVKLDVFLEVFNRQEVDPSRPWTLQCFHRQQKRLDAGLHRVNLGMLRLKIKEKNKSDAFPKTLN